VALVIAAADDLVLQAALHCIAVATLPHVAFLIDADALLHASAFGHISKMVLNACASMPFTVQLLPAGQPVL
jgi:hypothetical protein